MDLYRIVSKLDPEEWAIPERFLEQNEEFLQVLIDKVEELTLLDAKRPKDKQG